MTKLPTTGQILAEGLKWLKKQPPKRSTGEIMAMVDELRDLSMADRKKVKLIGPPTTFTPHCPLCQRTLGNIKDLGKFRWLQHNRTCRCGVRWLVGIRTKIVPGAEVTDSPVVTVTEVHYDRS